MWVAMPRFELKLGRNQATCVEQRNYAIPDAISANILITNTQHQITSKFPRKIY